MELHKARERPTIRALSADADGVAERRSKK